MKHLHEFAPMPPDIIPEMKTSREEWEILFHDHITSKNLIIWKKMMQKVL